MEKIEIKSISGQNFMSYKDRDIVFGHRTVLKGKNKCGKTTSKHLMNWVLLNKNAEGKSPDGIRPHDSDGKDTDHVEIVGTIVLDINGREVKIQKVQKQVWRTDRKTKQQRFDGNVNVIYVNDVEMKEKDFRAWIERVIGEERFMMCSNASVFFSKNPKDRREILFKMIPSYTNEDIIRMVPKFSKLEEILKIGTPEEIKVEDAISAVKRRINGRGSGDKGLKGDQAAIPVRIDEVSKKICDIAEFELAINGLKEQIEELEEQEEGLNSSDKTFDETSRKIMDLKFQQSEISKKANAGLMEKKKLLNDELSELQVEKMNAAADLRIAETELKNSSMEKRRCSSEVKKAQSDYTEAINSVLDESKIEAVMSETFDENSLICSECGQVYPEEMRNERKERWEKSHSMRLDALEKEKEAFEKRKKEKVAEVIKRGNEAAEGLKASSKKEKEAESKIEEIKEKISGISLKIAEKQKEIDSLPDSVDVSGNEEYIAITKEIEELRDSVRQMIDDPEVRKRIKIQKEKLIEEISSYQQKIKASQEAQDRVYELNEELVQVGQKIADAQKELDDLEEFNRTKIEMITDKINENFKFVKFRMFRPLVNGDYEPCCEVLVNGTSYDGNLNTGDKLLAELDLLSTFQRINDVSVPVFLDSAGEVDADRVPETDFQLIMLQRTDDKELTVEVIR